MVASIINPQNDRHEQVMDSATKQMQSMFPIGFSVVGSPAGDYVTSRVWGREKEILATLVQLMTTNPELTILMMQAVFNAVAVSLPTDKGGSNGRQTPDVPPGG